MSTIFLDFGNQIATPEQQLREAMTRKITIIEESFTNPYVDGRVRGFYGYKCCEHCQNNPINNPFATGFCNCVLPAMEQIRY